jgi:hypothetical protein
MACIISGEPPSAPKPGCLVCGKAQLHLTVNAHTMTLQQLLDKVTCRGRVFIGCADLVGWNVWIQRGPHCLAPSLHPSRSPSLPCSNTSLLLPFPPPFRPPCPLPPNFNLEFCHPGLPPSFPVSFRPPSIHPGVPTSTPSLGLTLPSSLHQCATWSCVVAGGGGRGGGGASCCS